MLLVFRKSGSYLDVKFYKSMASMHMFTFHPKLNLRTTRTQVPCTQSHKQRKSPFLEVA